MVEAKKREILARQANRSERDKIAATIDSTVNQVNDIRLKEGLAKYNVNDDNYGKDSKKKSRSRSRSKSRSKRSKKSKSRERKKSRSRSKSKRKRSRSSSKEKKKSRKRSKS